MALYDGVPSIRLEGDQKRALALIPEAKALLYKAQQVIANSPANTYSLARPVEDGYIYVLTANGTNVIHISVEPDVTDEVTEEEDDISIRLHPDFYSGTITSVPLKEVTETMPDGSTRRYYKCQGFTPTPDCIESHPKDGLISGGVKQDVERLAVEPEEPWMNELKAPELSTQVYSQYGFLRSSMYSGMMAKVVQLVMGLGRIGAPKMRDPLSSEPDSQYIKDVKEKGVQVRYDYKFHRTHGITVAQDGRLWLVEISMMRGVLAMPLPLFPRSSTEAFKERARRRKDDAMVWAVEELGALPTGECFPVSSRELEAKITAGTILRLMPAGDLDPFFQNCLSYSSSIGWAFSPDGREAHNTGWQIEDDKIQTGSWYQINIIIGPTKLTRQPNEPIAEASAGLRLIRKGRMWCNPSGPAPRMRHHFLPFKVYDPLLGGLVSHEGVPAGEITGDPPISDAPVFVCFVGNSLKVVSYYHNPVYLGRDRTTMAEEYGDCLLAGEWELIQGDDVFLPRMMYTNDFDYRREIQSNYTKETLESEDLGFKPGAAYFFTGYSDHWATGIRYKGFSNKQTVTNDISENITGVVIVPRFSREAFYFATADWEGKFVSDDPGVDPSPDPIQTQHRDWQFNLRDPNFYSMFVCGTYGETGFFTMPAYIADSMANRLQCRGGASCPFVSWGDDHVQTNPRMIKHYYAADSVCAQQYADEGPWLDSCEQLPQPSNGIHQFPGFDRRYNTTYPYRQESHLFFVTAGHNGPIEIETTVELVNSWWASISPDNNGNYQQISATSSAIGEDCVVYDTAPHDDPTRVQKVTGYTPGELLPLQYPTFVGVNIP